MADFDKAAIIAHQLVLERMLARLFDEQELASLKAECLGTEDALYQDMVRSERDHDALQKMLATVETLFAGAQSAQKRKPQTEA